MVWLTIFLLCVALSLLCNGGARAGESNVERRLREQDEDAAYLNAGVTPPRWKRSEFTS